MSDLTRAQYWLEATQNIRQANMRDLDEPEFWAGWLSALVNATMAAVPDSVMDKVDQIVADEQKTARKIQNRVQKRVKEDLNA